MANPVVIPLQRPTVVALAVAATRRAKIFALVSAAISVAFLLFGISDAIEKRPTRNDGASLVLVGVFALLCGLAVRRARRTTAAANRAAANPGTTWTLVRTLVYATDDRGLPAVDYTFKITRGESAVVHSGQALQPT